MSEGLIERDTEVRLLLLAALAGEHILYIGPPGTAKSELGRRLSRLAGGGVFFERLLTRFSVPEELFGPLSMKALEEDKYVRQTEGYLPSATVAFIDEVFKANSAILNTLLTLLNERLFDNGSVRMRVPLVCLVGASNELPESEELDALYDRFLVRKKVCQVSPGGLLEMLGNGGVRQTRALRYPGRVTTSSSSDDDETTMGSPLLTPQDFEEIKHKACDCVAVPASVLNLIADLRAFLQEKCEPPVYVSDRRLVKAVALLQVAAYTNGRLSLTEYDCLLLQHVLWQRPEECERIADWLLQKLASNDGLSQSEYLLSGMFGRACRSLDKPEAVKELLVEVAALKDLLVDRLGLTYGDVANGFSSVSQNVWLGRDEGAAIATALLPKLEKSRVHIESVLFEVVTLEVRCRFWDILISIKALNCKLYCRWLWRTGLVQSSWLNCCQSNGKLSYAETEPPSFFYCRWR